MFQPQFYQFQANRTYIVFAEVPGIGKMDPEMKNTGGELYWRDLVRIANGRASADTRALACENPEPYLDALAQAVEDKTHPAKWAQPVKLGGVPNLHKVSDTLYRSAQPTAQGMRNLKKMGVATVVNLRSFHSDRDELDRTGLGYEHVYMKAWHPERKEVVRFLQIATNPKRTPVLVHCLHGADRTGTMCAIYRIAVQGWERKDAIKEMTDGGYGFHYVWQNLIDYLEALDIDRMKKDAGMEE